MPSENEKAEAKAARDAAWWERWWAADYSWDGLAKLKPDGKPEKPWAGWSVTPDKTLIETADAPDGSRAATLQDYYRWDAGAGQLRGDEALPLVKMEGRPAFHILHLPPRFRDGSWTWKSNLEADEWTALETEAARLVAEGAKTEFDDRDRLDGADRRTQLQGTVLRAFPRPSANIGAPARRSLHLIANHAAFLGDCDASELDFGSAAGFAVCGFFGGANFRRVQLSRGSVDFRYAQFPGGYADFEDARFSGGNADFENAQFSSGDAYFINARFSGGAACFNSAQFSGGNANFQGTHFSGGNAYFRYAQFSGRNANFQRAQFSGGSAYFNYAQFSGGDACFWSAQFSDGNADFGKAQFSGGDAEFGGARFGYAVLNATDLGLPPLTPAWFKQPSALSIFDQTHFKQGFSAVEARFLGPTSFRGTQFEGAAQFGDAQQSARSREKVRKGAFFRHEISFRGAQFRALADFARCQFPGRADHRNAAFEGARFFESLDFKAVERLPFSAFQGALLDKGILIGPEHPKEAQFKDAIGDAGRAAEGDNAIRGKAGYDDEDDADFESRFTDARFASLEAGCGVLKHAMMQTSDRQREQSFYRMELIARRHRPARWWWWSRQPYQVTWVEKVFSWLYGLVGDYGGSASRPLLTALLVLPALFTLAAGLAYRPGQPQASPFALSRDEAFFGALRLAYRNALTPFHAWSESFGSDPDSFAHAFRAATGDIGFDILLGACHLQSLLSVILVFLAGLALRRKFQIS